MAAKASKPEPKRPRNWPGPSFWVAQALLLALAITLAFVPLFNLLAYEFCVALSLLVSATAGPVAMGVARGRPSVYLQDTRPHRLVLGLFLRSSLLNLLTLALPLLVILLNAWRVTNCNFSQGMWFFLLLPATTAVLASAWGLALGLSTRRRIWPGLAYAGLWLAIAVGNVWEIWANPQVDSFNQLTGWIAGPVFDEVLKPGWPLLLSRLHGLLWALFLLAAVSVLMDPPMNKLRLGVWWRNRRLLPLTLVLALAAISLFGLRHQLGFARSAQSLQAALGASTQTDHFVLHYPRNTAPDKIAQIIKDHDFRYHQIEKNIGSQNLPLIHSYLFPSAAQKRKWFGAGRTQVSLPWQYSIFLNGAIFPHPTLRHELIHVMAAGFSPRPLRISAHHGLWPNLGLIEGLAVAIDWPTKKFDPHVWSAALRKIGKAPKIEGLFDPIGFWSKAQNRSYTLAGSFVRFLLDQHDPLRFRRAYHQGSLVDCYDQTPAQLIADWETFLDNIDLPPGVEQAAQHRFSRPSLFGRTCAHEIAALRAEARALHQRRQFAQAIAVVHQIHAHLPDNADAWRLLAEIQASQGQYQAAGKIYARLLQRSDIADSTKVAIQARAGLALAQLGQKDDARQMFVDVFKAHLDDGIDRRALILLQALEQGDAGATVIKYLAHPQFDPTTALSLREAAAAKPTWAAIWYLLGRLLVRDQHFSPALAYLEKASDLGLGHHTLTVENLRQLSLAQYHVGRRRLAAGTLAVLAQYPRHQGDLLWARDWWQRIAFEKDLQIPKE